MLLSPIHWAGVNHTMQLQNATTAAQGFCLGVKGGTGYRAVMNWVLNVLLSIGWILISAGVNLELPANADLNHTHVNPE